LNGANLYGEHIVKHAKVAIIYDKEASFEKLFCDYPLLLSLVEMSSGKFRHKKVINCDESDIADFVIVGHQFILINTKSLFSFYKP
jgi:hypothetical protein